MADFLKSQIDLVLSGLFLIGFFLAQQWEMKNGGPCTSMKDTLWAVIGGKIKNSLSGFFFKKNTFVFFFVGSPKNSLAASLPYERKKAKHGRNLMDSSDANKLPQKK